MSWEVMCDEVKKCECGKGHRRYISEMDDFSNSRSHEYIDCKDCYEKSLEYQRYSSNCSNEAKHDDTKYIYVEEISKHK